MTREETIFYNILLDISKSLKNISESLNSISADKKRETDIVLKESRERNSLKRKESRVVCENKHNGNTRDRFIHEVMNTNNGKH